MKKDHHASKDNTSISVDSDETCCSGQTWDFWRPGTSFTWCWLPARSDLLLPSWDPSLLSSCDPSLPSGSMLSLSTLLKAAT